MLTVLNSVSTAIQFLAKRFGFDEAGRQAEREKELKEEHDESLGLIKTMMLGKIKSNIGSGASNLSEADLATKLMGTGKEAAGLRAKVVGESELAKEALIEMFKTMGQGDEPATRAGTAVFNQSLAERKERRAKVTGVQINDMKPNASGTNTGTADVTTVPVEQKGAAKTAEKVANVNKATAEQTRSQSPTT